MRLLSSICIWIGGTALTIWIERQEGVPDWVWLSIAIAFLVAGALVLVWPKLISTDPQPLVTGTKVTRLEWESMSEKFRALPEGVVIAELEQIEPVMTRSAGGLVPPQRKQESWRLIGQYGNHAKSTREDCEVLCLLAGKMLMRSPNTFMQLSAKAKTANDPIALWLYFLSEHGEFTVDGQGSFRARLREQVVEHKSVHHKLPDVPKASVRACIRCAANET